MSLLLVSFGGMAVCLGVLSVAAAVTPGQALDSFCSVAPSIPATASSAAGAYEPGSSGGITCFTCETLSAICEDMPPAVPAVRQSFEPEATAALLTIPMYTLLFSLGAGPVPWLLYNEVFPTRIRARAAAVCTALNYLANTIVGATFLPMISAVGLKGTYALYAAMCVGGYAFVDRLVFETKGLKLEEVEELMEARAREDAAAQRRGGGN